MNDMSEYYFLDLVPTNLAPFEYTILYYKPLINKSIVVITITCITNHVEGGFSNKLISTRSAIHKLDLPPSRDVNFCNNIFCEFS
jgi:hypothetical protein